jgi:hypothetical protein
MAIRVARNDVASRRPARPIRYRIASRSSRFAGKMHAMTEPISDEKGRLLAETISAELARRGFGDTMSAHYDPAVRAVLVGPVYLDVERQHEVYYPITLECSAIVDDILRRREDARES